MSRHYAYRATDASGSIARGAIPAAQPEDARHLLESRGLFVLELREEAGPAKRAKLPLREFADVLRGLSALLEAGLPLDRAIETSTAGVGHRIGSLLTETVAGVRSGLTLAAAFAATRYSVPAVTVGLIHAGDSSGRLGHALARAADHLDHDLDVRGKAIQALAYPALLILTGGTALVLMVSVVVPRFAALLSDWGQAMPPLTRAVVATTDGLRRILPAVVGIVVILLVAIRPWAASAAGQLRLAQTVLGLPGIGPVRHLMAGSRLAATLSAQVAAGIPLVSAMASAGTAAADPELAARLMAARERVVRGEPFDQAVRAERVLPSTADGLLAAGFHSARLEQFLDLIGRRLASEADARIKTALTLLEPGLIVLFGGVIAIVAAALLQAMYALRPASL